MMLQGVVNYSDSDSDNGNEDEDTSCQNKWKDSSKEDESDEDGMCHKKRKFALNKDENDERSDDEKSEKNNSELCHKNRKLNNNKLLPLPSSIGNMFAGSDSRTLSDTSKHQGRKRNFEHVEGNWATFVYIPLIEDDFMKSLYEQLCEFINSMKTKDPIHLLPLRECHLSLSRTVTVRHYWIDDMFSMLKDVFKMKRTFCFTFNDLVVYTNDNRTRTFVSLRVETSGDLLNSISIVDKVFKEYGLETYYTNPSFHVSVAWCLGDSKHMIEQYINEKRNTKLFTRFLDQPNLNITKSVCIKFGNKVRIIHLKC